MENIFDLDFNKNVDILEKDTKNRFRNTFLHRYKLLVIVVSMFFESIGKFV